MLVLSRKSGASIRMGRIREGAFQFIHAFSCLFSLLYHPARRHKLAGEPQDSPGFSFAYRRA